MNSHDDAEYRLTLAKGYWAKAENNATDGAWDDCLANSQETVENAGKSILSHFQPIPKSHDVLKPLKALARVGEVPAAIRNRIDSNLDIFENMGLETHIRATYGDEETYTAPWELIDESEATVGLEKARRAVALAEEIYNEMTGPPASRPDGPDATGE